MDGLLDRALRLLSAFDDDGAPLTPPSSPRVRGSPARRRTGSRRTSSG
nr:hypothetical protein [Luteimicrobium album]